MTLSNFAFNNFVLCWLCDQAHLNLVVEFVALYYSVPLCHVSIVLEDVLDVRKVDYLKPVGV